jgi:hypothetical protein
MKNKERVKIEDVLNENPDKYDRAWDKITMM